MQYKGYTEKREMFWNLNVVLQYILNKEKRITKYFYMKVIFKHILILLCRLILSLLKEIYILFDMSTFLEVSTRIDLNIKKYVFV